MSDYPTVNLQLTDENGNPFDLDNPLSLPALGFKTLAVTGTAAAIPPEDIPGGSRRARITVDGDFDGYVRYRIDAQNPTLSSGHRVETGEAPIDLVHPDHITGFRVINPSGVDVNLHITFF